MINIGKLNCFIIGRKRNRIGIQMNRLRIETELLENDNHEVWTVTTLYK